MATKDEKKAGIAPLYQLPNGDWIDPIDVRVCVAVQGHKHQDGSIHKDGVIVLGTATQHRIDCANHRVAEDLRDRIALQINDLRQGVK